MYGNLNVNLYLNGNLKVNVNVNVNAQIGKQESWIICGSTLFCPNFRKHCAVCRYFSTRSTLIPALADTVEELLNAYKGLLCYQKIINKDTENLKSDKYFAIKM